jgi:hypothetical protein
VENRTDRYLAAAESCVRLAAGITFTAKKLFLIDLATKWTRLAEKVERQIQGEGDGGSARDAQLRGGAGLARGPTPLHRPEDR